MNTFQKKSIAAIVTAVAIIVFARTLVYAVAYSPDSGVLAPPPVLSVDPSLLGDSQPSAALASSSTITSSTITTVPSDYPKRLDIPSLGIDANVQDTGITAKGTIGTPNNFTDVAWYKYGPVPGEAGDALIDGHVDNGLGLDGVFKHLSGIKAGDEVSVTREDGTRLEFVVSDVESYPYTDVPMALISSRTGPSRLVLVTCGGDWVSGGDTYDHRLVVTAELATSTNG